MEPRLEYGGGRPSSMRRSPAGDADHRLGHRPSDSAMGVAATTGGLGTPTTDLESLSTSLSSLLTRWQDEFVLRYSASKRTQGPDGDVIIVPPEKKHKNHI
ncbi:hypothetical protein MRX96_056671 [Rhipicephalus microplus]